MSFRLKTILGVATIEIILVAILITSGLQWLVTSNENDLKLRAKNLVETSATVLKDPVLVMDFLRPLVHYSASCCPGPCANCLAT